jgi:iron complex transport system ATP-binding protein
VSIATAARSVRRVVRLPGPPAADGISLRVRDVTVSFGGTPILEGVDVDVRDGELLALVGPNGAGKSTLLSVLSGDLEPDRGTVELDGADVASWTHVELAMRRAVLLQQLTMTFPFTVRQTVEMGRSPWSGHEPEDHDERRVAEAMTATDVVHLADRTFPSLSGGERARAGMARVIAQDARVLLLDEPTAALDVRHQEQVLDLASDLARAGGTVVVVMHDLGLAAAYADRVVILAGGRVRADGSPSDVLTGDLLSEVYEHPIEVFPHPRTGELIVLPERSARRAR